MSETRNFSVDPKIIFDLIVAQAGTLGKAVLECVMNSVDAHATRIDITIDAKSVRIQDDGRGFQSRDEIESWFEVFGFPHTEGDRTYGKFGIGRGQLWSFCSTLWRTGPFQMDVDIKRRGLNYGLLEGLEPVKGTIIEGVFYNPMITSELVSFQKELAELARFAQIPVTLNGKQLRRDPAQEQWDLETTDAWIQIAEGSSLAVYNLGVLVCRYPAYQFGCGGVVVTKPGVRLSLNMARNDILVSDCEVWKRIRRVLQSQSDERVKTKRVRLSDAELENFAKRFVSGELQYEMIDTLKLVTDIVGRGHTLRGLTTWMARGCGPEGRIVTRAEAGSRIGERAHTRRLAFVLSAVTLERFGVDTVTEFLETVQCALGRNPASVWQLRVLDSVKAIEKLEMAVPALQEGYEILKDNELTKADRAALRALDEMAYQIGRALSATGYISQDTASRRVFLGVSDVAEAWTDARSMIVVERQQLALMKQGIGGFVGLTSLLVHEFLHDKSDVGSHTHDQEFYARFHDATCGRPGGDEPGRNAWSRALDRRVALVSSQGATARIPAPQRCRRDGTGGAELRGIGAASLRLRGFAGAAILPPCACRRGPARDSLGSGKSREDARTSTAARQSGPNCRCGLGPWPSAYLRLRRECILTILDIVRNTEGIMNTASTLTSKGQTTIPKQIRDGLRMKTGDRMTFTLMPDGVVLMRVKNKSVMNLAGSLYKKGRKPVPVEQLSR